MEVRRFCPACGDAGPAGRIAYGLPLPSMVAEGPLVRGGCVLAPWRWACLRCGHRLDTPDIPWRKWTRPGELPDQARARWLAEEAARRRAR